MKVKSFDRATVRAVQQASVEALRAALEPFGLTVQEAGGTIGDGKVTLRFDMELADPAAKGERDRTLFMQLCRHYGFAPEQFGGTFIHKGSAYAVIGFEPTRPKYPVRARRIADDKVMLFQASIVAKVHPASATL